MRAGLDGTLQSDFATYLISYAGSLVGQQVEKSIWQGAAATGGEGDPGGGEKRRRKVCAGDGERRKGRRGGACQRRLCTW